MPGLVKFYFRLLQAMDIEDKRVKITEIKTPAYVIDEAAMIRNLKLLNSVEQQADCKILLAQKCFSGFAMYPLIAKYISGTTASGIYEARLGYEEMAKPFGSENHIFSPGYQDKDFDEILEICDHIVFNSISQLEHFRDKWTAKGANVGLRINPEISTQEGHEIYDPCAPYSRFGVKIAELEKHPEVLLGVSGIHFHTLCEQDSDALEKTVQAVRAKFGKYLKQLKWINLGGGHHITREGYDVERLIRIIKELRSDYDLEVFLEPGEAIALNAGYFVTTVLDKVYNDMDILLLDGSAACHMPDVLEMPYRPPLCESGEAGEKAYTYRLTGATCLAGDIIGDYSFDAPKSIGDRLIFEDMAIYSMVKNNTFNGMPLPSIYRMDSEGNCVLIKEFGYEDFKGRLS